jgi:hypothetical protein
MDFLLYEIWNKTNIKEKYYGIFMRLETHSVVRIIFMEFFLFEIWNKTNIKEEILKEKYYDIFIRLKTHSVVHIVLIQQTKYIN